MKMINVCLMARNYVNFFWLSLQYYFWTSNSKYIQKYFNWYNWCCPRSDQYVSGSSNHPSIKNIRAKNVKLVFSLTSTKKIEIKKLLEAWTYLKLANWKIFLPKFSEWMPIFENPVYAIGESPQVFKRTDIISVNKKKKSDKTNYRPVSVHTTTPF